MSDKVAEALRGRESEVGLGGLGRRAGRQSLSQAEAEMQTIPSKTADARIAADSVRRRSRTMAHTPATSLRRSRGGAVRAPVALSRSP